MNNDLEYNPLSLTQDIGETEISYLLYGNPPGPTILFLHATGFLPWLWHPLAVALSSSYRVVVPSLYDHRDADPATGTIKWSTLAEDCAEFCRRLRIKNPLLVGHSMGGTVSAIATAFYGLPSKGLILIEPVFLPENLYGMNITADTHPMASKALTRTNNWKDQKDALHHFRSRELFKSWDDEILKLYVRFGTKKGESGGFELVCSPKKEAALFMGDMDLNPWPLLSKVTCPVLIVEGETSEFHRFFDFTRALSLLPHSSHTIVKGAGHLIPMEQPDEVTRIIQDFVKREGVNPE